MFVCYLPVFRAYVDITYHDTELAAIAQCIWKTRETGKFYRFGTKANVVDNIQ